MAMTIEEVQAKVIDIIVDQLNVDKSSVTPTANFIGDLGADSLDTVELIMKFEKEFDITINEDEAQQIQTVRDAITHVHDALNK